MKFHISSSISVRQHGRTPGAASACMYSQCASREGVESIRMVE
jgi:hypothetical protein